jgi:hypothetical protein
MTMLRQKLVPILTFTVSAAFALGGCGSSSSGTGGSGGSAAGAGGSAGGSGGGSGGAAGGSGGASGGSGGASGPFKCGSGMGGTSGSRCTDAETSSYNSCTQSKCSSEYSACIGNFASTGQIGGKCATYFTCANACACTDGQCLLACYMMAGAGDCINCLITASSACDSKCPRPACMLPPDGGAGGLPDGGFTFPDGGFSFPDLGGGGGASCDDLKKCCDMITEAQQKNACTTVVGFGQAESCSQVLQAYKAANVCK